MWDYIEEDGLLNPEDEIEIFLRTVGCLSTD
jgi:hypothetical protein